MRATDALGMQGFTMDQSMNNMATCLIGLPAQKPMQELIRGFNNGHPEDDCYCMAHSQTERIPNTGHSNTHAYQEGKTLPSWVILPAQGLGFFDLWSCTKTSGAHNTDGNHKPCSCEFLSWIHSGTDKSDFSNHNQ